MNEKMKPYYERYDKAFEMNDLKELAFLNQFADNVDIRKWNREQICMAMAEKDGLDVSREKDLFHYHRTKSNHPNCVILFRDEEAYYSYEDDAEVLNKILGCPILDWDGIKAAGFPYQTLDTYLPKLIRANYRVAIRDNEIKVKKIVNPARKEPIQLSLF